MKIDIEDTALGESTTDATARVERYTADLRAQLIDLPDEEIDEIITDVGTQLHETAADDARPLAEIVGSPEAFAAELRQSAGLDPAPTPPADSTVFGAAFVSSTDRLWKFLVATAPGRAVIGFVPELRPAWWVLRGYLVVATLTALGDNRILPIPHLFGSSALGLLTLLVAMPASVRLGRQARDSGARRIQLMVASAVLAFAGVLLLADAGDPEPVVAYAESARVENAGFGQYGDYPSVTPAVNYYPYDADGHPLSGVRLYDQSGQPVVLAVAEAGWSLGLELEVEYPIDAETGLAVTNEYPLSINRFDPATGRRVSFGPPLPTPTPTVIATTSAPAATTDPAPTTDVVVTTTEGPAATTTTTVEEAEGADGG